MNSVEDVHWFVEDLLEGMRRHVDWRRREREIATHAAADSATKEFYGDAWVFFYGVTKGRRLIYMSSELSDRQPGGAFNRAFESVSEEAWQEEYEEYGYGAYARGLEIGKRLAVWSGPDKFEFVEPDENDEESKFTFTE